MNKSKILFLINDITALGGTERMCSIIANELSAINFEITIISKFESKKTPCFQLSKNITRKKLLLKNEIKFYHFLLPFYIYQEVKQLKPDIIISCDTQVCLYSSFLLIGRKHIAWEHFNSSIFTLFGSRWFGRRLASIFCKKLLCLVRVIKKLDKNITYKRR